MSSDEAEVLRESLEKKWDAKHRDAFFHKMERKFRNRRERFSQ